MGHGSYRASDWAKLKNSRGISASSSADQIFKGNTLSEKYDPKFINMRESCDSDDSPESTPIILGFDVTGSMGYLAAEIAKNSLNRTVTEIYDKQPVTNPHIMCAAFTGLQGEGSLQVTQFEADIRVVEQLLELKVGFGGNTYSYDSLVWYFAAKHTSIDSFKKRGKKGILICIGDEVCGGNRRETLQKSVIKAVYADNVPADLSAKQVLDMASEQYEIFHIVTGARGEGSLQSWSLFLPGRVAELPADNIDKLAEVIISIMQLAGGLDRSVILSQWDGQTAKIVEAAIATVLPENGPAAGPEPQNAADSGARQNTAGAQAGDSVDDLINSVQKGISDAIPNIEKELSNVIPDIQKGISQAMPKKGAIKSFFDKLFGN